MPSLLVAAVLAVAPALAFALLSIVYRRLTSPWRYIPGPKSSSFIHGSTRDEQKMQTHDLAAYYAQEYGHVLKYKSFLGVERLYVVDAKALSHIVNNGYEYERPPAERWIRGHVLGHGLLSTEGDYHRQQRKAMNLAFGTAQIGRLTEIFVDKAIELRKSLEEQCVQNNDKAKIDVVDCLLRMTLDIIGLTGFNRDFEALRSTPSQQSKELHDAFDDVFSVRRASVIVRRLKSLLPALRVLPEFDRHVKKISSKRLRIAQQLLEESRASALGTGEKGDSVVARDILSLLVKANLSDKESQKMTDSDVLAQITTFILAGHETTSTSASWALYSLCKDQEMQKKLRQELLSLETDHPTMEELNSLTYLDCFVKETLRYHAPVPSLQRTAAKDDIIPLSRTYTDVRGLVHSSIIVKKGQEIEIPILAANVDKSLWGEDALEFKPERWASPPTTGLPGIWSNMLSFMGGAHSCIGFKFSVVEMKAILYVLLRAFEFEFAVDAGEIIRTRGFGIERPCLRSATGRDQLPLFIRPVRQ